MFNTRTQNIPMPVALKTLVKYINVALIPFDRKLVVFISRR